MPNHAKTYDEVFNRLREILEEHGDLESKEYDELNIDNKPCRALIRRLIGEWQAAKTIVMGSMPKEYMAVLQQTNNRLSKQVERQRNLNQIFIENCLTSISKCSFRPVKIPKSEKKTLNQQFHLMRSDDQVGEKVESKLVQGIAEYNIDIYKQRFKKLTEKILLFKEQDKRSLGLNKLVIHALGDFVEGEQVYRGQPYYIDANVIDQLITAMEINVNGLLSLASEFSSIEIYGVQGNHGRIGGKGDYHVRSNFDYLFYVMLRMALKQQKNIKVFISDSPTMIVQHGRFNFALNHFDNIPSHYGIPYYGIDRKVRKMSDLYKIIIHYKLGGHFHTSSDLSGGEVMVNGSMVGGSVLSINRMTVSAMPSQRIFYFDPEHGIHRKTDLYLESETTLTKDENNIYTPYVKIV